MHNNIVHKYLQLESLILASIFFDGFLIKNIGKNGIFGGFSPFFQEVLIWDAEIWFADRLWVLSGVWWPL